ncbi:MAG: hypothetical protein ACM359_23120 [Bacillota bacterium]
MAHCESLESRRFLSTTLTTKDAFANRDLWASDIAVGAYTQTKASDNRYQQLTERVAKNTSSLEHYWRFKVAAGDSITFNIEAWHNRNREGDHFELVYSTDARHYTPFLSITKTKDDNQLQTIALPSNLQGTVYIRVRDTDRRAGMKHQDTLYVDRMFIRSQTGIPHFNDGTIIGRVTSSQIIEASGLVASRKHPGVLWTHNDGGNPANIIAIDTTGHRLATYHLKDTNNVNWEDIAIGPGPTPDTDYLYIADIGDNSTDRKSITVYRVLEPAVSLDPVNDTIDLSGAVAIKLKYPDHAHDAEALIFDPNPTNGGLFIITKSDNPSRIFQAPLSALSSSQTITLIDRGSIPDHTLASAADLSFDGTEILVRYNTGNAATESIFYYQRLPGQTLWDALHGAGHRLPYTLEPNGEAIAWSADASGYYTLSEGQDQPLYFYPRQ